jgi:hypothetical protein
MVKSTRTDPYKLQHGAIHAREFCAMLNGSTQTRKLDHEDQQIERYVSGRVDGCDDRGRVDWLCGRAAHATRGGGSACVCATASHVPGACVPRGLVSTSRVPICRLCGATLRQSWPRMGLVCSPSPRLGVAPSTARLAQRLALTLKRSWRCEGVRRVFCRSVFAMPTVQAPQSLQNPT